MCCVDAFVKASFAQRADRIEYMLATPASGKAGPDNSVLTAEGLNELLWASEVRYNNNTSSLSFGILTH